MQYGQMSSVSTEGLVFHVDFELVTNTPFYSSEAYTFYTINHQHKIDYELAHILGLGVVRNLHIADDYYLYDIDGDRLIIGGLIKACVYYQITHPDYDDEENVEFWREAIFNLHDVEPAEYAIVDDGVDVYFASSEEAYIELHELEIFKYDLDQLSNKAVGEESEDCQVYKGIF